MRSYNEKKVPCPYNEKHIMPKNRLIWHIAMVCEDQKKYKDLFETCPYFALHIIKKELMKDHKTVCKYRPKEPKFEESKEKQQSFKEIESCYNWGIQGEEKSDNNKFQNDNQIIQGWNDGDSSLWWGNNTQEFQEKEKDNQTNCSLEIAADVINEVIEKLQAVNLQNN